MVFDAGVRRGAFGHSSSGAIGPIWLASIRDLQWRSRRFLLAVLATGVVFGLALMILSLIHI